MAGGQPIGFGVGILVGGILTDTIGWRWGFYTAAIANTARRKKKLHKLRVS